MFFFYIIFSYLVEDIQSAACIRNSSHYEGYLIWIKISSKLNIVRNFSYILLQKLPSFVQMDWFLLWGMKIHNETFLYKFNHRWFLHTKRECVLKPVLCFINDLTESCQESIFFTEFLSTMLSDLIKPIADTKVCKSKS